MSKFLRAESNLLMTASEWIFKESSFKPIPVSCGLSKIVSRISRYQINAQIFQWRICLFDIFTIMCTRNDTAHKLQNKRIWEAFVEPGQPFSHSVTSESNFRYGWQWYIIRVKQPIFEMNEFDFIECFLCVVVLRSTAVFHDRFVKTH